MRNMSFAITKEQIINQSKTVTRRLGWKLLEIGDLIQPVEKSMGMKKGEKIKKIGCPIKIISVNRESLWNITASEVRKEGFQMTVWQFIRFFSRHMKCDHRQEVTRIEFEYTEKITG